MTNAEEIAIHIQHARGGSEQFLRYFWKGSLTRREILYRMQSTSIDEKYIYENFVKIALIGFKSSIGYLQKDILYGN